jgi:uncharacterized heparinase superfamily protein
MASGLKSKLSRVLRMDWEEVRVRAAQEIHKQCDLIKHRFGMRAGIVRLNADSLLPQGRFFFSGSEGLERAELLRKFLPDEAARILREADEICAHRFRLLGYKNLDCNLKPGNEIDWHLDAVHGKRAPMDPWFKIPFLDFAAVGDHKVTWELNRHQHLVTLAKARLLSGDKKYTHELMAQWRSWIKANPYPLGINWGSTLEVAFRSLSWIWAEQLLAGVSESDAECAQVRSELTPALAFHGRYIERYLSTYFSPNTHLLGEAVALFFLGTLYPQVPGSTRWKESGWKTVLHEAKRQVRPDGVYFEQSLHYHVYALDFFLHARLLAARNAMEIPPAYDAVLGRMLDIVAALAQAGPAEGFGDDDGGRLWNPRRNRTEHMTDPLALGAVMYLRTLPAAQLTEEVVWLFGDPVVAQLSHPETQPSATTQSIAFPDGGLYVLADSEPFKQAMVVDAGPQGVGRSGHGHADALSVRLTMAGQRWLVDSGSGVYIAKDPADRNVFRGTGAHNTIRVDGADQAVADEPFSWTNIPTTIAENWVVGKTFTYFVGSHNGYERLADPVVHRRHVLKIAGGALLVRDMALGREEHELDIRWHFAPDLDVRSAGPGRVKISRSAARQNEPRMTLIAPEGTVWQGVVEISTTQLSPAYGAMQTASLVRYVARVQLPAEVATALIPGQVARQGVERDREPRFVSTTEVAVQVYELDYHCAAESHGHEERQTFFFARVDCAWNFGPWSSDARMLYCRMEKEKLSHLIFIGGTYVTWHGEPLLKASRPSGFIEWRKRDAVMNAEPREFSVTPLFEELTGEALASFPNVARSSSPYAEKH